MKSHIFIILLIGMMIMTVSNVLGLIDPNVSYTFENDITTDDTGKWYNFSYNNGTTYPQQNDTTVRFGSYSAWFDGYYLSTANQDAPYDGGHFLYRNCVICNKDFTMDFWFKIREGSLNQTDELYIYSERSTGNGWEVLLRSSASNTKELVFQSPGTEVVANVTITDTMWHWGAIRRNTTTSNCSIYLDGLHAGDVSCSAASGTARIGANRMNGAVFNGSLDNIRMWFSTQTDSVITTEMYQAQTTTPVNSSWNVTTDNVTSGENSTVWDSGGMINLTANNLTLSVTADVLSNMSCAVGLDWNYTAMVANDSNYKASTTETVSHSYTVYDNLSLGSQCLYCAFINTNNENESSNSSSGCLNVSRANIIPYMTSVELNKTSGVVETDDLNCTATGKGDDDVDHTAVYHYDWVKNGARLAIDKSFLKSGNTSNNDNVSCIAYVTDGFTNSSNHTSSTVSVGSSLVTPSITTANATTAETETNSTATDPTANNSWINMSVLFTDSNTEKWTGYFCNASDFTTCLANASAEILCRTDVNSTSKTLSCNYSTSGYNGTNPMTIYAFVIDNSSLVSTSKSLTFETNNPPDIPTISTPSFNGFTNETSVNVSFTSSDDNSDTINYTIYNSTDNSTYTKADNSNESSFNWSGLTAATYFVMAYTIDAHSHSHLVNSSSSNFTVDRTSPTINVTSPVNGTNYTGAEVNFSVFITDTHPSHCNVSIYYNDGSKTFYKGETLTCNGSQDVTCPVYSLGYIVDFYVYDEAGNSATEEINITTVAASTGSGGGPGSGDDEDELSDEEIEDIVEEEFKKAAICGNGVCQDGENPISCPEDCPINVDALFCILGEDGKKCSAWVFNVIVYGIALIAGYAMYKKQRG